MSVFSKAFERLADPFVYWPLWLLSAITALVSVRLMPELGEWAEIFSRPGVPDIESLPYPSTGAMALVVLVSLLVGGAAEWGFAYGGGVLILALAALRKEESPSLGLALAQAAARMPAAFATFLLVAVGLMTTVFVAAMVATVSGSGILVALVFFLIVWLLLHLGFAVPLVFDGRARPWDALAESWSMVSGRALTLLVRVLAVGVVRMMVGFFTLTMVSAVTGGLSPSSPLAALALTVASPLVAMVTAGLYLEFLDAQEADAEVPDAPVHPDLPAIVVPRHRDALAGPDAEEEPDPDDDGPPEPVPPQPPAKG